MRSSISKVISLVAQTHVTRIGCNVGDTERELRESCYIALPATVENVRQ